MSETHAESEGTTALAIESVGLVCARATLVALVMGGIEGNVLARVLEANVRGMGLATVGLWVPAAFVALLLAVPIRKLDDTARRALRIALVVSLAGAALYAKLGHASGPIRAAPLEILGAIALGWAFSSLKLEGALRKLVGYVGIALTLVTQLHANRWVDAHRAYAGAMAQTSFVPRLMLRSVFRRVL